MADRSKAGEGTLERAIEIAARAHLGQTDKAGACYILHPLRVMMRCGSTEAKIVAVLHDVVEDATEWDSTRLREEGFSEEVVRAVESVTKMDGEDYLDFCRRAAADPLGREVKRADLEDNMNLIRLDAELTDGDLARLRRYRRAWEMLR